MFITFEGGEGCGKSTHSRRLKEYLESLGHKVVLTREPGGTLLGEDIRKILLSPRNTLSHEAEILLFAADRIEHVEKVIKPALKEGKTVISDRFIDSTTAYQIGGRKLAEDQVRYLNMISSQGLTPDLTFILETSVKIGLERATRGSTPADRFEKEDLAFHERVRKMYLEIAEENPERVKVINTERPVDEVQKEIREIVGKVLSIKQ